LYCESISCPPEADSTDQIPNSCCTEPTSGGGVPYRVSLVRRKSGSGCQLTSPPTSFTLPAAFFLQHGHRQSCPAGGETGFCIAWAAFPLDNDDSTLNDRFSLP
jgi:hypothetical protein